MGAQKVFSTSSTNFPDGSHFAQTVVRFAHLQVQAMKRGVLGWGWGCFVYVHITERVLLLSKEQGMGVVF